MNPRAQFAALSDVPADWLIVGAWENEAFGDAVGRLNRCLEGILNRLRERGDFTGKAHEMVTLLDPHGIAADRLLVVGLGERTKPDQPTLHDAAAVAARAITGKKFSRIA